MDEKWKNAIKEAKERERIRKEWWITRMEGIVGKEKDVEFLKKEIWALKQKPGGNRNG